MKQKKIPLYDLKLSPATIREATEALKSGWLSSGPRVRDFEKAIAAYTKTRYAAAVNSATAGLISTLTALGLEGRQIITTPFSFVATTEAILRCGAQPVFADIRPETLSVDADEVLRKITPKTGCILPVDIAGFPADYDRLSAIANQYKLPLVSDASHALGATRRGKSVPQLTDAAIFSFHATKNLTCGEGGMVVSKHKSLIDRVRTLSLHGLTSSAYQRRQKGKWAYDVTELGFKANLSEVHAAIGLGNMREFETNQRRRQKLAGRYLKNLAGLSQYFDLPMVEPKTVPAWHLFIIRLHLSRLKISRNRFIALMAERGVECGVHYIPIHEFSFYRQFGVSPQHLPNTTYAGKRVVTLPLFAGLKVSEVDYVCEQIESVVTAHKK